MTTAASTVSTKPPHDALITPKSVRLSQTAPRCPPSHYRTDPTLRHMTKTTRTMSRIVPTSMKHKVRDGGGFRWLADSMVTSLAIPMGALTYPSAARDFLKLSKDCKQLRYGDHESQFIDVFLPNECHGITGASPASSTRPKARGMVFFVHGGAWGSGKPWFYRLVTKPFLEEGLAVAIVGYRVYPLCGSPGKHDGHRGGVRTQVDDLETAFGKLTKEYPEWCDKKFENRFVEPRTKRQQQQTTTNDKESSSRHPHYLPHLGTIVMGHSSGAHISMLWMVERVQKTISDGRKGGPRNPTDNSNEGTIDAFVGVSGVYNIGHHFDYEAGRGVEELSPLKPANGFDRKNFAKHSPPWKVQHELIRTLNEMDQGARDRMLSPISSSCFPSRMLLVHGSEDDVVPLPGTGEAAKILKQCLGGGSSSYNSSAANDCCDITIDEFYVPLTGHQDTAMDLMMLGGHKGPVTRTVVKWLLDGNRQVLHTFRNRRMAQELQFKSSTMRSKL